MHLRQFVSGSAVILSAWLAYTFIAEVPSQRYPKLDKYQRQSENTATPEDPQMAASSEAEISPLSLSQ